MIVENLPNYEYPSGFVYNMDQFKLDLYYILNQIKPEGKIVYEYNPFRNYRISKTMDSNGKFEDEQGYNPDDPNKLEPGSLVDFITPDLGFSLTNPVDIVCQQSYDGSINLILNDNLNIPRLINSRFSVLENNTYKIVDRIGNNDTNIYDQDQFDLDTSLYKRVNTIPEISFKGLFYGGNLKVGNYVFYFKFSDADGNETDFVGESGIVTCHIGNLNDPRSIRGGISDENSYKSVQMVLTNIDTSYDYVTVYYTRSTSNEQGIEVTTAFKIDRKFVVKNNFSNITITGNETAIQISVEDINVQYLIADKVRTQAVAQNMLFLGNITKPDIPYEDLMDLSLRFLPYYTKNPSKDEIGELNYEYEDVEGKYEYYNVHNIYHKLGYWNEEIYRIGVVYILNNNTLSPVFNIRGRDNLPEGKENVNSSNYDLDKFSIWEDSKKTTRSYLQINESTYQIGNDNSRLENSKGVIRINDINVNGFHVFNIGIAVPKEITEYLQGKVKGFFFVRQKRIPTILCQALTMGFDKTSGSQLIYYGGKYLAESFINGYGVLTDNYLNRLYSIEKNKGSISNETALCPEFEVKQPFYNNLFTGTEFYARESFVQTSGESALSRNTVNERHYYIQDYVGSRNTQFYKLNISAIGDNCPVIADSYNQFRARFGDAEEAYRFRYLVTESSEKFKSGNANNIIRGSFGPYLGITKYQGGANKLLNIYISGYSTSNIRDYFQIRYEDSSAYYAIGDRIAIESLLDDFDTINGIPFSTKEFYRGDCFICNYTHRLNRNFQDPEAPNNDEIVDENTWKDNYKKGDSESNGKINRGDVNAIPLGNWITFKVYSSSNLSMRNWDDSFVSEVGLTGKPRGFFPLQDMSIEGNNKIPESFVLNPGIDSTTSDRWNFELPDVPYIKNEFQTRISYSDITTTDAFKNGFRVFQLNHYRDYPKTYGGLMKLVELFGNLLCVFEHGVALIPVNERAVAGKGSGGDVFINTSNVLPENPKMLSDMYGTQWAESVIKTPYYVYGVDTVGKKIWRTNGSQFEIISDFKIQAFLNDNITLTERELTPIIGVRNVKTHYNAYKGDVMFTFYDNLYGFEEKVWNICYNEVLQRWVTFYSWVPSYSENIDNIYFSFDRNTSKWISKLGTSNINSTNADGIVLSDNVFSEKEIIPANLSPEEEEKYKDVGVVLTLKNRALPNTDNTVLYKKVIYKYSLEEDNFGNREKFDIFPKEPNGEGDGKQLLRFKGTMEELSSKAVWLLNIKVDIDIQEESSWDTSIKQYVNGWKTYQETNYGYYQNVVAVTSKNILEQSVPTYKKEDGKIIKLDLNTDFWKHGQAGIIDIKDKIKPTFWYGKQHPFELEFVVAVNPLNQKIFSNLQLLSNKAAPDSFHYEIVGECYSFSNDKPNMYFRQEYTKQLYQNLGSDILFNRDYINSVENDKITLHRNPKSTIFPLYYARQDTFNEIEDFYIQMTDPSGSRDYMSLSGSEIVYDERLNEFRIATHVKGADFDKVGRMRGNMNYQEDKWLVQIPSLTFMQKNETWTDKPPIVVNWLPDDLKETEIREEHLPNTFNLGEIDTSKWTYRQEARLRDKYLKVKIRYTGEDKVIITAIKTLFNISYA